MKKLYLFALAAVVAMMGLTACGDDNDQLTDSRLTHYVVLEMLGNPTEEVILGSSYTDAGCKGTLEGVDVSSKIIVDGLDEIDVNTPGLYYVTYSAVNADGFVSSVSRTVAVFDPNVTADISGKYTTQEGTYLDTGRSQIALVGYKVNIDRVVPGVFAIDEMLGGMWSQRAGYGSSYAMHGFLQLTPNNTIHIISGQVPGWGDTYDDIEDGVWNPETGEITYALVYAGYYINVVLNK